MFYAIREGHYDIVEYLINIGADINKLDKKKLSPYAFALKHNKIKIAELLADKGAIIGVTGKGKDSKKSKTKKKADDDEGEKSDENKPKRYLFIKVLESGEKIPLTEQEIEKILSEKTDAHTLLSSQEALEEEEANAPEE
jgi:ankyrin repeat protein